MKSGRYTSTVVSISLFLFLYLLSISLSSCRRLNADLVFGKTVTAGDEVAVDLTPRAYSNGRLEMEIRVTTHTVNDLDRYDLKQITLLRAPGIELRPVSAPQLRGHHNRGKLVFELTELPSAFQVEIRGLPGKEAMTFKWP